MIVFILLFFPGFSFCSCVYQFFSVTIRTVSQYTLRNCYWANCKIICEIWGSLSGADEYLGLL